MPTIAEAHVPGFDATLWLGLLASAGTPKAFGVPLRTDYDE